MSPSTLLRLRNLHFSPSFLIPLCEIAATFLRCSLVYLLCKVNILYFFNLLIWIFSISQIIVLLPFPKISLILQWVFQHDKAEIMFFPTVLSSCSNMTPTGEALMHAQQSCRSQQLVINSLTQPFLQSLARSVSQPLGSQGLFQEQVLLPRIICTQNLVL